MTSNSSREHLIVLQSLSRDGIQTHTKSMVIIIRLNAFSNCTVSELAGLFFTLTLNFERQAGEQWSVNTNFLSLFLQTL